MATDDDGDDGQQREGWRIMARGLKGNRVETRNGGRKEGRKEGKKEGGKEGGCAGFRLSTIFRLGKCMLLSPRMLLLVPVPRAAAAIGRRRLGISLIAKHVYGFAHSLRWVGRVNARRSRDDRLLNWKRGRQIRRMRNLAAETPHRIFTGAGGPGPGPASGGRPGGPVRGAGPRAGPGAGPGAGLRAGPGPGPGAGPGAGPRADPCPSRVQLKGSL